MEANNHPGDRLVKSGVITAVSFELALARQKSTGQTLGAVLSEMGVLTEEQWIAALAKEFGYKTVNAITGYSFPPELLSLVPGEFAAQHLVFPLKQKDTSLALAVTDPFDSVTIDYLARKNGLKIIPFLASRADINAAIKLNYPAAIKASYPTEIKTDAPAEIKATPAAEITANPPAEIASAAPKRKILVVDDSLSIAAIIQGALQKEGYEVIVGHDGMEGLKLTISERPDLIICDTVMPRMDGFGLLRALKGSPVTAQIPVILVTAKSGCEDEQRALEAGFLDFISKPVQPVRLISRVKRAFELSHSMTR
jgi:CheY-like chemotaxis protein